MSAKVCYSGLVSKLKLNMEVNLLWLKSTYETLVG